MRRTDVTLLPAQAWNIVKTQYWQIWHVLFPSCEQSYKFGFGEMYLVSVKCMLQMRMQKYSNNNWNDTALVSAQIASLKCAQIFAKATKSVASEAITTTKMTKICFHFTKSYEFFVDFIDAIESYSFAPLPYQTHSMLSGKHNFSLQMRPKNVQKYAIWMHWHWYALEDNGIRRVRLVVQLQHTKFLGSQKYASECTPHTYTQQITEE